MGDDIDDIMKGWPRVKREAVVEAIKLASAALVKNTGARSEADAEADLQVRLTRAKLANHEPVHLGRAN